MSGTLAGRGFNIESLVVCATEIPELSRFVVLLTYELDTPSDCLGLTFAECASSSKAKVPSLKKLAGNSKIWLVLVFRPFLCLFPSLWRVCDDTLLNLDDESD